MLLNFYMNHDTKFEIYLSIQLSLYLAGASWIPFSWIFPDCSPNLLRNCQRTKKLSNAELSLSMKITLPTTLKLKGTQSICFNKFTSVKNSFNLFFKQCLSPWKIGMLSMTMSGKILLIIITKGSSVSISGRYPVICLSSNQTILLNLIFLNKVSGCFFFLFLMLILD